MSAAWLLTGWVWSSAAAGGEDWVELIKPGSGLMAFRTPTGEWREVGTVHLSADDPTHLVGEDGEGVIVNDPPGRTTNLLTSDEFQDVDVVLEFNVPKRSNSGIKLMGLYEIQIFDSYGAEDVTGSDNGGVYPRAELLPRYRHLDEGHAPRENASRPPGEWQTLEIRFRAPRFSADGEKIGNACFERVVLNGKLIHENLEVPYPTGHAWNTRKEVAKGPIMLQADHGPVAFRGIRVRSLQEPKAASD